MTQIAGGGRHSLFLKSDGSLWAMGDNWTYEYGPAGQLGDGTDNLGTNQPEQIVESNVVEIAAGYFHSLFIKSDGSLWGMGNNGDGELMDGTYNNTNRPEQIVASNVVEVAAGWYQSFFIKSDGSLWGGGPQPVQIMSNNVTAVAAGAGHTVILKNDGSLWAMGDNSYGQLGDGSYNSTNLPEEIVGSNVTAIIAGAFHSLFLKSDGSLWSMGDGTYGQLGIYVTDDSEGGSPSFSTNQPQEIVASNVIAIAAGYSFSLFLKGDGSLWAMGRNDGGQLGDGTYNNAYAPEEIVSSGVTAIAAGAFHSLFTKTDGSLWGFGVNTFGALGDGTYIDTINQPEQTIVNPGYNRMSIQLLSGGNVSLSYFGITGTNYVLDHSFSLSPAGWLPEATNAAGVGGVLVFTNMPVSSNDFWRIRSAQ